MQKKEGFREQRLFVLPEYMHKELAAHPLTSSLYVSDIGYFPAALHHYRERPEGSDAHIFIYCAGGGGVLELGQGKAWAVASGQMAVIPPNIPHRYWASEQQPWSIYWFHLKGEHTEELVRLYLDPAEGPVSLPGPVIADFISTVDQSFAILSDKPFSIPGHVHTAQAMRHLLSSIGMALAQASAHSRQDHHLDSAMRYMSGCLGTTLRLPELARHVGLSRQHLIFLFKKETGFAPIDYFLRMKMQHAAQLLDLTGLTVKEIGASVGIADPYYFSRLFKRLMGYSPSEYRKVQKG